MGPMRRSSDSRSNPPTSTVVSLVPASPVPKNLVVIGPPPAYLRTPYRSLVPRPAYFILIGFVIW